MDFPIPNLELNYNIKPRSIIKSKYFYIIACGGSLYRLYPFMQDTEQAEILFELSNNLIKNSGVSLCPIISTTEHKVCSEFEQQPFILTIVPKGYEPDLNKKEDFGAMVKLVGAFHNGLRAAPLNTVCPILPYEKGLHTLANIKKTINRKNKLSEIDKLFCENYSTVYTLAETAADKLSKCNLKCSYAYGNLKEENFVLNTNGITLTNWSYLRISHFLTDTAYLIKRYNRKCNAADKMTNDEILECYTEKNPLSDLEATALESIIHYPEKYIDILKEYYGKHRPFAPVYVREKLLKELDFSQKQG